MAEALRGKFTGIDGTNCFDLEGDVRRRVEFCAVTPTGGRVAL